MNKLTLFIFLLFLPCQAWGAPEIFHATATGAGGQDGSDLANAWSNTDLNGAGNWSDDADTDGDMGHGDTVKLYDDHGDFPNQITVRNGGAAGLPLIFEAAEGETPVFGDDSDTLGHSFCFLIQGQSHIILDGLTMKGAGDSCVKITGWPAGISNVHLKNCTFIGADIGNRGIYVFSVAQSVSSVTFENCSFSGCTNETDNIEVYPNYPMEDIWIKGNNITDGHRGIRVFSTESYIVGAGKDFDYRPSGLHILDNNIWNVAQDWCEISTGISRYIYGTTTEKLSYISGNSWYRCGYGGLINNVNGLQLNWCDGVIVENNDMHGVETSVGDGNLIIVDWAWTDYDFQSRNCVIRNNVLSGALKNKETAAVSVYRGSGTSVYGNVIYNCGSGLKHSANTLSASSGNSFFNNTITACDIGFVHINGGLAANITNNIFDSDVTGIQVDDHGAYPVESYNLFGANLTTDYDIVSSASADPAPVNPVYGDPLFVPLSAVTGYRVGGGSPAIDAGSYVGLTTDHMGRSIPWHTAPDIGAYEGRRQKSVGGIPGGVRIIGREKVSVKRWKP